MKVIIFACLVAAVSASGYAGHGPALMMTSKLLNTGSSTQSRKQDGTGNYAFSYSAQSWDGGLAQKESGDGWGNKAGSYSLNVADGRQRTVKYVADGHGFRASIHTNEPGTAAKPAADTTIDSPYAPPVAPAPLPLAHGSSYGTYDAAPMMAYASAPAAGYAAPAPAPAALPAGAPFAPLGNGKGFNGCYNGGIGCDFGGAAAGYKGYAEGFSYNNAIEHTAPAKAAPVLLAAPAPAHGYAGYSDAGGYAGGNAGY